MENLGYEVLDYSSEVICENRTDAQTYMTNANNTESLEVTETLTTYNVVKDGETTVVRSLKAAPVKHTFGSNGDLNAKIVWRDNLGPSNDLIYVEAHAPSCGQSLKRYDYWKMGWYSSSSRQGTWNSGNLMQYAESGYSGLQFCLQVTANGKSLQINTSVTDRD